MKIFIVTLILVLLASGSFAGKTNVVSSAERIEQREIKLSRFSKFKDRTWVKGVGRVKKVLEDDLIPPCHQRFILEDRIGHTILISHNIEKWERLNNLKLGDYVRFKGEFIDNEHGGLVHWTHPDPAKRKPGGYVKIVR